MIFQNHYGSRTFQLGVRKAGRRAGTIYSQNAGPNLFRRVKVRTRPF